MIGYTLFSWLAILAKNLHNFVGPILIIAVPFLFIRFVRDNGIGMDDVKWFLNIKGYFQGHETPSGRFNAGEKIVFWLVLVVASTVLVVTGLVLRLSELQPDALDDADRQRRAHAGGVRSLSRSAFVHIYLGTIGMAGAYRAMRYGYVDESWAQHHHLLWYEQVVAGRSPQKIADPRAVPREAIEPRPRAGVTTTEGTGMTTLRALLAAALVIVGFGVAVAKLPPLTDEQKTAAAAKKEKDADVGQEGRGRSRQGAGSRRIEIHRRAEGQGQDGDAADGRNSAGPRRGASAGQRQRSKPAIRSQKRGRGPVFLDAARLREARVLRYNYRFRRDGRVVEGA